MCQTCGMKVELREGKPIFSDPQTKTATFDWIERGPEKGTPWRQANWKFLKEEAKTFTPDALILDVGAGHGDFSQIFLGQNYIALDVIPYPEVDIVCDLTRQVPFPPNTFEAILLMNVLEHVYDYKKLLVSLSSLLRPGGKLLVSVPFMIKIHQAPTDFHRFTHYSLMRLASEIGLVMDTIEGFYDPISFLGEGISNLKFRAIPSLSSARKLPARLILTLMQGLSRVMALLIGKGRVHVPTAEEPAVTGYHLILTKAAL